MYSYSGIGSIKRTLNNGKFTESEVKATKSIAKCRIHVKRASARLKEFKFSLLYHHILDVMLMSYFNCVLPS